MRYTNGQTKTTAYIRLSSFPNTRRFAACWKQSVGADLRCWRRGYWSAGDAGFGTLQSGW